MPQSKMSTRGAAYIGLVVAAGLVILIHGLKIWDPQDWVRYLAYCAIALIASGMKVKLPGITGTDVDEFLFVLIGVSELGFPGRW